MPISVLLIEDDLALRTRMRVLVGREPDLRVVAESELHWAVTESLASAARVIVLGQPGQLVEGPDPVAGIRRCCPDAHLLVVHGACPSALKRRSLQLGARGLLDRPTVERELVPAIRSVLAGGRYLSESSLGALLNLPCREATVSDAFADLSQREWQILRAVVGGLSCSEVARRLALSPKTVDTYRWRLMQKLEVSDFAALVRLAALNGVEPGCPLEEEADENVVQFATGGRRSLGLARAAASARRAIEEC